MVFLAHYKKTATDQSGFIGYDEIRENLDLVSAELWFFDSKPSTFDLQHSDSIGLHTHTKTNKLVYYRDPLERLKIMREYS